MGARDLLETLHGAGFRLEVTSDGGIRVAPASALSDVERDAIRTMRADLLALLVPACRHGTADPSPAEEDSALTDRRRRLIAWGWSEADADALARRLVARAEEGDDRVSCAADCAHYRPGRCRNFRRAGLDSSMLSQDMAGLPQRCPGFHGVR